ncbi:dihydrofolate reductase family protein [Arthrobacter sp. M4]|uniref:dihydrofolate reductase family protein n=1 Tax=Arthrobacter sp. M4 TaxID=218160 RepID=UPI001CDC575B|nr:dihydrofolate reductase family protein [Arthrobacter sp. M4]MCA4131556.1 dihydrofolate reductase family protein [Arthrobacter sp. M4]
MPAFQYYVASTIDGFIATADDDLGWLLQFEGAGAGDESVGAAYEAFFSGVGSVAMGGTTYRWLLDHMPKAWPYPDTPCWVFTHREYTAPEGADITFVRGPAEEYANDLQAAAGGKNVWLVGGGDLVAQFANAGLLDEIIVSVIPVLLGDGKRLLPLKGPTAPLELVSSRTVAGSMVELHYRMPRR